MKTPILATALFLVAGVCVAAELSFEEAKAKADQTENSLAAESLKRLVEAQGGLANSAFPYCFNNTQTPPPNFTVVVEIDTEGRVARSWVDQDTPWGLCFRERMVKNFSFRPESQPFFTSFEYKNAP